MPAQSPTSSTTARALVVAGGVGTAAAAFLLIGRARHYEWLMFGVWGALLALPISYAVWRSWGTGHPSPLRCPSRSWIPIAAVLFAAIAGAVSYQFRSITIISDETAYRFQSRIFASGLLVAQPPWSPEEELLAPTQPEESPTPLPLTYSHHIYRDRGWFVKYPLGFPFVLAAGQIAHVEWLINPLLGAVILVLTALLARNVFDDAVACLSVSAMVLSPFFLGNSIGFMSHPLCGALVAAAFFFCFRVIDSQRLAPLVPMLLMLTFAFHTRPYTAFLAAVVLSAVILWSLRAQRVRLVQALGLLTFGAVCIVGSVAFYNWSFTGSPLLSPYSLYKNTSALTELDVSLLTVARNVFSNTRFGIQGTLLSTVPGLPLLGAYGLWRFRKHSIKVWALGAYFALLTLGYAFNPIASASRIGERFWYEGFFGVAIVAAAVVVHVARRPGADARTIRAIAAAIVIAQVAVSVRLLQDLHDRYHGYAAVTDAARELEHCRCAVFLALGEPYESEHLNLNSPQWREADAIYLIDPGAAQREQWAQRFGFDHWKVIAYDPRGDKVEVQ